MIQNESVVIVADNTGAKKAKVIRILKGSNARSATVGDLVVVAIKSASSTSSVPKGKVSWAVIVRTKKELARPDGTYIRFADNAVVLVAKDQKDEVKSVGKRVFGPVAKELREK
jgi:large subunit ribosomal protein L14